LGVKNWEHVLSELKTHKGGEETKTSAARNKAQKIMSNALGLAGMVLLAGPAWLGKSLPFNSKLPQGMIKKIFWDLCELSF
jgi:hypothetical protein